MPCRCRRRPRTRVLLLNVIKTLLDVWATGASGSMTCENLPPLICDIETRDRYLCNVFSDRIMAQLTVSEAPRIPDRSGKAAHRNLPKNQHLQETTNYYHYYYLFTQATNAKFFENIIFDIFYSTQYFSLKIIIIIFEDIRFILIVMIIKGMNR